MDAGKRQGSILDATPVYWTLRRFGRTHQSGDDGTLQKACVIFELLANGAMKFLAAVVCLVLSVTWAFQVRSESERAAQEQISIRLMKAEFKEPPNLSEAEVRHIMSAMAPLYERSVLSLSPAYLIAGNVTLAGVSIWIWVLCTQKRKPH